ncbi:hypothetical protein SBRCBS47491_005870 [Sporothrix bragantina]|uniref:Cyanovirin-N domain-containing protein n=1 Tax=Sporothrix bragantina TaxID=671064 RepID=A0ABP0C069_9PEZI
MKSIMSSTVATTLVIVLAATVVPASPVAKVARQDTYVPELRGGFTSYCDFYQVLNHGEAYGHLQANCNFHPGNPSTEVATSLDLSLCMGNYNDNLAWGYLGGAFASCTGCNSRHFDTQYLDCDCGSVDLNVGIYVTPEGAVACYDQVGEWHTVPQVGKE